MHRPTTWAWLEFTELPVVEDCRNIEHPGRHVARSLHLANHAFAQRNGGLFTENWQDDLIDPELCNFTFNNCDLFALVIAAKQKTIFNIRVVVETQPAMLNRTCTQRPCYEALVQVNDPSHRFSYTVSVNENRWIRVISKSPSTSKLCL